MTNTTLQPCPVCGGTMYEKDGDTYRWKIVYCGGECGAEWELSARRPLIEQWDETCRNVKEIISNRKVMP